MSSVSLDADFAKSNLIERIRALAQQLDLGGGVGSSLRHQPEPEVSRAGRGLELWVKHFLAGTINQADLGVIGQKWTETFSFHGGVSNPPDAIVRHSIAVEVKKAESGSGLLQLNSSWPIRTLRFDDQHITKECRECESWTEKPFLFIVGKVSATNQNIEALWIVDGRCLSDNEDKYISLLENARNSMLEIGGIKTTEIGRFHQIDSARRTSLRVRPMFQLIHPADSFSEIFEPSTSATTFVLNVLMPETSYDAFDPEERIMIESASPNLRVARHSIEDPAEGDEMRAVLVSGSWKKPETY